MALMFDSKKILAEVKANLAARDACPRHRIEQRYEFPKRSYRCAVCGAAMDPIWLFAYMAGFKAAGGDPTTIWSDELMRRKS